MFTFADAVTEVKDYIASLLRSGIDVDAAAEEYVWRGIEKGADDRGYMHAEIRGQHSYSGNPIPFSFHAVDE